MVSIKKHSLFDILIFLMGVFSLMPILTIPLGGARDIALFRLLYYGIVIYMFIGVFQKKSLSLGKYNKLLIAWLLVSASSSIIGYIFLLQKRGDFAQASISGIPKIVGFILFSLLWGNYGEEDVKKHNYALLKGMLIGCIINILWAIIDATGYYLVGKSINNLLFTGYIHRHHIRYDMLSLAVSSTHSIRASGFNYDPAQLGFVIPVVVGYALYKKKPWLIVISILGTLASISLTSFVSSVMVIVVYYLFDRQKTIIHSPYKIIIKERKLFIFLLIIGVCFFLFIKYSEPIINLLSTAFDRSYNRVSSIYFENDGSDIRWKYFIYAPIALVNLSIFSLTGLGFGTASYGYTLNPRVLLLIGQGKNYPFDPENTYISYLLDTGIIGFTIFVIIILTIIKYFRCKSSLYIFNDNYKIIEYCLILAMIFSMCFYHYILFAPHVLIMIIAVTSMDIDSNKICSKNVRSR